MFKCGICKKSSQAGEKARRVVIETRNAVYPRIAQAHHYQDREGTWRVKDDPGGCGTQIVKEMLVCTKHD
jgi:hypothetical protein